MKSYIVKVIVFGVFPMTVLLLLVLTANSILPPEGVAEQELSKNGLFVYDEPREFKNFSLIDHNGNELTQEFFNDKWTLVFFGFTSCPDICPLTMASLGRFSDLLAAQTDYAENTQVIMISVDPKRDTPEKMAEYVTAFNEDFVGATGELIDIFSLASEFYLSFSHTPSEEMENTQVSHSGQVVLIDPDGLYHGFLKPPHEAVKMLENYKTVRARWNR